MERLPFPAGKSFAFTILDDTDGATVTNVGPVYRLFEKLGMRTTKTVWSVACPEGSKHYHRSQTLDDPEYRTFALDLQRRGVEIATHGATMETSSRDRIVRALDRFREIFGDDPKIYVCHANNQENLYWGRERLDDPFVRVLYGLLTRYEADGYMGHRPGSMCWWGDLCAERITYVRNLTFTELNLFKRNPSMPYKDPARSYVNWWFSTSLADSAGEFTRLLQPHRLARLEEEGGVCIVSTHLAKGFVYRDQVNPEVVRCLESVAKRNGWFVPVGDLLDWLRVHRREETLPPKEWRRMQRRYILDAVVRNVVSYLKR